MKKVKIIKYHNEERTESLDAIAIEKKYTFQINGEITKEIFISPNLLKEFATGYLISTNLINNINQIKSVKISAELSTIFVSYIPGSVDQKIYTSKFEIQITNFYNIMGSFRDISPLFRSTGGVHSASITAFDRIIFSAEDSGRHNALDKVIGYTYLNSIEPHKMIICISSRVSLSIIRKVFYSNFAGIISISAPTSVAIEFARKKGLILIGFARDKRFNIYSGEGRIHFY